ncbi:hypothetical protein KUCAC02_025644, partial [Chaenocephalus aceratus]
QPLDTCNNVKKPVIITTSQQLSLQCTPPSELCVSWRGHICEVLTCVPVWYDTAMLLQYAWQHLSRNTRRREECFVALHFNENANRVQGVTKAGEAMYSIKYPKGRKGAAVLRRVLESPTYEYAQELLAEVVKECTDKENVEAEFAVEPVIVPPPLCAEFPHPEKSDFVKQHLSRFKK